ncbi:DUF3761 domain-containing protein [Phenylobacterium sp.]|jgi:hypothetical protein|uniref:DUF3761 domain-containing protein n=1 Tax=Phenylobacterium sp. TaxID=1871053 RepID=UPI002F41B931
MRIKTMMALVLVALAGFGVADARGSHSSGTHSSSSHSHSSSGSYGHSSSHYYTNVSGHRVHRPVHARSAPHGASARCGDGSYSFSEHHQGTCSHHGGVSTWMH